MLGETSLIEGVLRRRSHSIPLNYLSVNNGIFHTMSFYKTRAFYFEGYPLNRRILQQDITYVVFIKITLFSKASNLNILQNHGIKIYLIMRN